MEKAKYLELQQVHQKLVAENEKNHKMKEAMQSYSGQLKKQTWNQAEQIDKLEQLKGKFTQQAALMKSQAASLQAQLDHQRARAEALSMQLTNH